MTERIGPHLIDRDQPPLSADQSAAVRLFHQVYYDRWRQQADTLNITWFGHLLLKCPLDLWMYQELLVRTRPDVVVETGTFHGGSALYLASILDLLGGGEVITIDVTTRPGLPAHPRIEYVTGSSTDDAIVQHVRARVAGRRAMVILDSDHTAAHVYAELLAYSALVQRDDYLIVEDTNVNGHPAWPGFGPGPMEAVERFLPDHPEFAADERCQRFLMTLCPGGYLKRVAA
jgi:cephalosporin hydroxylase